MKRLYHHLVQHRWGEASDLIIFDRERAAIPGSLDQVHVGIWDPDGDCDVTSFMTLGMSELVMPGADYRAELTLGVRGALSVETRRQIPVFLANVSEYPFAQNLKLDWWERLANPGAIPAFPDCSQLLLAPMFGDDDFRHFPEPDSDVRVLSCVPITPKEAHILKEHGRGAFLDYWDESGVDVFAPRRDPVGGAA
jgi:hypothetical protein